MYLLQFDAILFGFRSAVRCFLRYGQSLSLQIAIRCLFKRPYLLQHPGGALA